MERVLLRRIVRLSRWCADVPIQRLADNRRTEVRHRCAELNLPLQSVIIRLRRRLVVCEKAVFVAHMRDVLRAFELGIRELVTSMWSQDKGDGLVALLKAASEAIEDI